MANLAEVLLISRLLARTLAGKAALRTDCSCGLLWVAARIEVDHACSGVLCVCSDQEVTQSISISIIQCIDMVTKCTDTIFISINTELCIGELIYPR